MAEKKKSWFWNAVTWVVVIFAALFVFQELSGPDEDEKKLADPESALKFYLKAAWELTHSDNNSAMRDIELSVTEEDWDWFRNSYDSLFVDTFNLTSGIDPTSSEAIKKGLVLRSLLECGVYREDAAIIRKDIQSSSAVLTVNKLISVNPNEYQETDVTLVKEGRYWKVKGFAGAREIVNSGAFYSGIGI